MRIRYFWNERTNQSTRDAAEALEWELNGDTVEERVTGEEHPIAVHYGTKEARERDEKRYNDYREKVMKRPGGWKAILNRMAIIGR